MKALFALVFITLAVVLVSGCTQPTGRIISDTSTTTGNTDANQQTQPQTYSQPQAVCRTIQEAYTVQVPYLDQDCQQIPYQDTEAYASYLQAQAISSTLEKPWNMNLGFYALGKVALKNVDNRAGWFTVTFNWETLNDEGTDNVRHYIEPDETITFESVYDIDMGEDVKYTYTYVSDQVQNTRTVTKYRTECHEVTRQREETRYRDKQICD